MNSSSVKLIDVAQAAAVDIATVSRALNRSRGWERLSSECVERVEREAKRLGYRPNVAARGLRRQRSDTIGVLMNPTIETAFNRELLAGIVTSLGKHGLHALMITGKNPVTSAMERHSEGRIDGVIAPAYGLRSENLHSLREQGTPHVLTHVAPDGHEGPAVALHAAAGIEAAVDHLVKLGHRDLVWAGPDPDHHADGRLRAKAFQHAVSKRGLPEHNPVIVKSGPELGDSIANACQRLIPVLSDPQRPHAMICYHDPIALGAISAARHVGLEVPRDLSIIGFDDSYGQVADPPLTTLSHAPEEIADAAVEMLLDILKQKNDAEFSPSPVVITPRLVLRESTGPY